MDRRRFLGLSGLAAAGASLALGADRIAAARVRRHHAKPNIVIVNVDDMPVWMLDHMPKTRERLLARGTSFVNGHCNTPLCAPNRASLLTGRHVHNHSVHDNAGATRTFLDSGEAADALNVRMRRAGYATGLFGKWMNGYKAAGFAPEVPPGWDRFISFTGQTIGADDFKVAEDGKYRWIERGPDAYVSDTAYVTEKATSWMRLKADDARPFFVYLAPIAPHSPYQPAHSNAHLFDDWSLRKPPSYDYVDDTQPADLRALPSVAPYEDHLKKAQRGKLRECADVDDAIETLCNKIHEMGLWQNTVLFFTSDNGQFFGEHRLGVEKLQKKRYPYQEAESTPIVVRGGWNGAKVGVGVRRSELAQTMDITCTIYALAGADPSGTDGRDLSPLLSGRDASWRQRLYAESLVENWRMVREGDLVYLVDRDTGEEELYDLALDPYETRSLHGEAAYAGQIDSFRQRVTGFEGCSGDACRQAEEG